MKRSKPSLPLALLLLAGLLLGTSAAAPRQAADEIKQLWFRARIRQDNLAWFNENARATDIASVDSRNLDLLDQISVGRKQALFASALEAEQIVPSIADKITDLCYDLEHWAQTPAAEQSDPVDAVKRMRALADKYDLTLMLGPDRRFTEQYGAAMAPYVDIYLLQVQRLQGDPASLVSYMTPLVQQIRAANPDVEIVAQLRTEGSASDVLELVGSLAPHLDGVSLLMNAESQPMAGDIVRGIGQGIVVSEAAATAAARPGPVGAADSLSTSVPFTETQPITGTLSLTTTPDIPPVLAQTVATPPSGSLSAAASTPAPEAPLTGRRSTPVGTILLAGAVGAALGVGGLVAYLRLRRKGPAV